jgi:hypothetical protein
MTLGELHSIRDFAGLFADARLRACLQYLREHPNPKRNTSLSDATSIIRSEGSWHGWFEALAELENLSKPPVDQRLPQRGRPYAQPEESK